MVRGRRKESHSLTQVGGEDGSGVGKGDGSVQTLCQRLNNDQTVTERLSSSDVSGGELIYLCREARVDRGCYEVSVANFPWRGWEARRHGGGEVDGKSGWRWPLVLDGGDVKPVTPKECLVEGRWPVRRSVMTNGHEITHGSCVVATAPVGAERGVTRSLVKSKRSKGCWGGQ